MPKKTTLLWEEYKLAIETQMHFNKMILRARTFGLTAVVVILGASLAFLKNGECTVFYKLTLCISLPTIIISFALILLTSLFLMDILYYFPLLLGAVERSAAIEKHSDFRLTESISNKVGSKRTYWTIGLFYGFIFIAGIVLLVLTLCVPGGTTG